MVAAPPIVRPRPESHDAVPITFDGRALVATEGDTVSTALLSAGIVATSRSLKFRRPRGPFCLQGDCGTCLVRIAGHPNLRACTTPVAAGLAVAPQNRVLDIGPDPTALVDKMFQGGMDHHHFMVRPRFANRVMQEIARNLSGLGTVPDAAPRRPAEHREHRPDVLVVGAGRSGSAAARRFAAAGITTMWVDRSDARGLLARIGVPTSTSVSCNTAVFGIYQGEGLVAAVTTSIAGGELVHVVHTIVPRHVVLATGAREVMIPLPNNDLPGVLAAEGLRAALARTGDVLARPAVVVGTATRAQALADALGSQWLPVAEVKSIGGSGRVEHIVTQAGKLECDVVALAAPPAPVGELARQAGARVRWNGEGFPIERDADGRCATVATGHGEPFVVWACGRAAGVRDADVDSDGAHVAESVLAALSGASGSGRARKPGGKR
jgi:sarcosine oxidase subunit alpha